MEEVALHTCKRKRRRTRKQKIGANIAKTEVKAEAEVIAAARDETEDETVAKASNGGSLVLSSFTKALAW